MTIIIAIAGGSCSGKTTLARYLQNHLGDGECLMIRQDDYYYDIRDRKTDEGLPNFDVPSAVDFDSLASDLLALKSGKAVALPNYDFKTHQRVPASQAISPCRYTVVEGLLLLDNPKIREIADCKTYMKCSYERRFARRLSRDVAERGRTEDFVREQFAKDVEPAHQKFIQPSVNFADIVIDQDAYLADINAVIDTIMKAVQHNDTVFSPTL